MSKIGEFIELIHWQNIQDLFADVIGVTIYTVEIDGTLVTKPSNIARLCSELRHVSLLGLNNCLDCISTNINKYLEHQQTENICRCGGHCFVIPITVSDNEVIGFLIVGPFLIGSYKRAVEYQSICEVIGINFEFYMDSLREIKTFTHTSARSVVTLLSNAINYMIKLGVQKAKFEQWFPAFLNLTEANRAAYVRLYVNKLLNSLMDMALSITRGDSGSVLLYGDQGQSLHVKITRNLNIDEINMGEMKLDEHIAGIVALKKNGFLIDEHFDDIAFQPYLKRKNIRSSFVVPILQNNICYGVFTINAYQNNTAFTGNNLHLLHQLGELVAITIASLNTTNLEYDSKSPLLSNYYNL